MTVHPSHLRRLDEFVFRHGGVIKGGSAKHEARITLFIAPICISSNKFNNFSMNIFIFGIWNS